MLNHLPEVLFTFFMILGIFLAAIPAALVGAPFAYLAEKTDGGFLIGCLAVPLCIATYFASYMLIAGFAYDTLNVGGAA